MSGPSGFLESAVKAYLDAGCLIVTLPPGRRESFGQAIERRLSEIDVCGIRRLDVGELGSIQPGDAIAERCIGVDGKTWTSSFRGKLLSDRNSGRVVS